MGYSKIQHVINQTAAPFPLILNKFFSYKNKKKSNLSESFQNRQCYLAQCLLNLKKKTCIPYTAPVEAEKHFPLEKKL